MEFRIPTQEDLAFVRQNPFEEATKNYPYMEIVDDNCFTALYESQIVAVGGCQIRWEGVGLFWLFLTADCKKHDFFGVIALDAIKKKVDELIERNKLFRAEAYIRPDFPEAIKMIEFLGFNWEGNMEKFFPDKHDAFLYARII